jgi:hypothetical protein
MLPAMRSRLAPALVAAAAVAALAAEATAAPSRAGLALPARSRPVAGDANHFTSGLGFRKTVVFFRRQLARRGLQAQEIPAYGYRGVLVSRFLAKPPRTWLAVHIYRLGGKTYVYVVPAPAASTSRSREGKPLTTPAPAGR